MIVLITDMPSPTHRYEKSALLGAHCRGCFGWIGICDFSTLQKLGFLLLAELPLASFLQRRIDAFLDFARRHIYVGEIFAEAVALQHDLGFFGTLLWPFRNVIGIVRLRAIGGRSGFCSVVGCSA